MKLELKRIGNSTGLILPKDLLARLGLQQGDAVVVSETGDRGLTVQPFQEHHDQVLEETRKLMKEYRNTFQALAK
jgi:putative addiction module antidote